MKKWLLVFLVCLGILISCIYLFIPNTITIQLKKSISANSIGFQRAVMDDRKWEAWWPGKHCDAPQAKISRFCLNGYSYTILEKKLTTILLSASDNQYSFPVTMNYIGFSPDSIQLIWHAEIPA